MFRSFAFNVIIDTVRLESIILLFVFYLFHLCFTPFVHLLSDWVFLMILF